MQRIAVWGCGYVGLVTAACFAELGHDVVAFDTDLTKIAGLRNGRVPFFEPGLSELIAAHFDGRLRFSSDASEALHNRRLVFIAVGTPTAPTGEADLTYVRQAARDIADAAEQNVTIVNKSTVPVETADLVERVVHERRPDLSFSIASNPEFLREGSAIEDFLRPDRIVVGVRDPDAAQRLRELYEPLEAPFVEVDLRTAEMIKYAANAFLATKISFINEIANVCAAVGADVEGVIRGISLDPRIGAAYLKPGLGYGGSCLPKDVSALAGVARSYGIEPTMMDAVSNVNRRRILVALSMVERAVGELDGKRVAVLGAAFKGGTDDLRESPSLVFIDALLARGAEVRVFDAHARSALRRRYGERVTIAGSPYTAARDAHASVIANDEPLFAQLDWERLARAQAERNLVDLRNHAPMDRVDAAGLRYFSVGRACAPRAAAV